jgi:hypothetical protein
MSAAVASVSQPARSKAAARATCPTWFDEEGQPLKPTQAITAADRAEHGPGPQAARFTTSTASGQREQREAR